jgi:hypothetical protein
MRDVPAQALLGCGVPRHAMRLVPFPVQDHAAPPGLTFYLSTILSDLPSPAEALLNKARTQEGFAKAGNRFTLFGIVLNPCP